MWPSFTGLKRAEADGSWYLGTPSRQIELKEKRANKTKMVKIMSQRWGKYLVSEKYEGQKKKKKKKKKKKEKKKKKKKKK